MTEAAPLFSLAGFAFYPYGLVLAGSVLVCLWLIHASLRRRPWPEGRTPSALSLVLLILPGALLGARIVYCLARLPMILADLSLAFLPRLWLGGYSAVGAVLGGLCMVLWYAKARRVSFPALADALVPAAGFLLMAVRLGEVFTDQGLGHYVMNPQLQFLPLAVQNPYGEYQLPVFLYEGIGGLLLMLMGLAPRQGRAPGAVAGQAFLFLCVSQIFLESLREDDFLRFGFVRFTQLACAVGLFALLVSYLTKRKKALGNAGGLGVRVLGFFLCLGAVIAVEFALDKSIVSNVILYAVMAVALLLLYALVAHARLETGRGRRNFQGRCP